MKGDDGVVKTDIDVETPDEVMQIKSGAGDADTTISSVDQARETIKYAMQHNPPKKVTFAINKDAAAKAADLKANIRQALEQLKAQGFDTPVEVNVELIDFSSLDVG